MSNLKETAKETGISPSKIQKCVRFSPGLVQKSVHRQTEESPRTARKKSRNVRKNMLVLPEQKFTEKQVNEGHGDEWRSQLFQRVTRLVGEVRDLRRETGSLICDFARMEIKFQKIKKLHNQVNEEATRRLQNLDEVIYLNGLINHLEIADRNMQYEPCHVIEGAVSKS